MKMLSLMAKEVEKRETDKGSSEYKDRAIILAKEVAKTETSKGGSKDRNSQWRQQRSK